MPSFPTYRGRRLRRTEALRRLVRATSLVPSQLVLPLFVRNGSGLRRPIDAMPGVAQTSPDELLRDASAAAEAGVGGVILFGIPDHKDSTGSEAWAEDGAV
ncbi:MAG: porphobilinogen synthase, partial [Gemmatimonas sp.]